MIYSWDQTYSLSKVIKAHDAEVTALACENGKLVSGGKDKKLQIYTINGVDLSHDRTIAFEPSFPKALDYANGKFLVGLRNGSIYEIDEVSEAQTHLLASHHEGEAWGLDIDDEHHLVLSCGDDNKVMIFDYEKRSFVTQGQIAKEPTKRADLAKKVTASTLSQYPANQQGRSVAYNPLNGHVAVSNNMGKVTIRTKDDICTKIKTIWDAEEWSEVMKYSPDH